MIFRCALMLVPPPTAAAIPATIDAPVLAQTSAAGASPFEMDVTFDTDTVQDGDFLHWQIATDSGFVTVVQEDTFILQPADIAGGETSNWGYSTPSGLFYIRARVERDDGVSTINSAWSNTEGDTITAASTQLHTAAGVNRNTGATITGTPPLTLTSTGGTNAFQGSRATNAIASGVRMFEATPGTIAGIIAIGIDNGVTDFSTNTNPSDSNNACSLLIFSNNTAFRQRNGSFASVAAHVAGDKYSVVHTKASGLTEFYRTRSGVTSSLGSETTPAPFTNPYGYVGGWQADTVTVNFGQSTFARTLTGSEVMYG